MNVELAKTLDSIEPGRSSPILIIDLRDQREREYIDLPKYTKKKAPMPRVNIPLFDLIKG